MIKRYVLLFIVTSGFWLTMASAGASSENNISADERCPVCGMFVAKYEAWITRIRAGESSDFFFDGVKDMMAFYQNPAAYNGPERSAFREIRVKDYYSLEWLDGRRAFYVIGSDVYGPMGHELIPFASRAAAESFLTDHHGRGILSFDEITVEIVEELRAGSRMKK
ncbi:MAG: nitrous oxide reductase accessory protein NosL [Desulfurivibrionaceae bacterium]|nr:nitrous oxide reductase accessory protein NosL [Desulfurivibrionaceae bacterium]